MLPIDDASALVMRIKAAFKALVVNIAKAVSAAEGTIPEPGVIASASSVPGQSDVRVNKAISEQIEMLQMLGAGLQGESGASVGDAISIERDAGAEVDKYLNQQPSELPSPVQYPITSSLEWWKDHGRVKFPFTANAARVLLAIKASAGHMEQDFSLAGFMVAPRRGSLDSAYVDMTLVLKALKEPEVPRFDTVTRLDEDARKSAIPHRYTDRGGVDVINELDAASGYADGSRSDLAINKAADKRTDETVLLAAFDSIEFDDALEDLDYDDLSDVESFSASDDEVMDCDNDNNQ